MIDRRALLVVGTTSALLTSLPVRAAQGTSYRIAIVSYPAVPPQSPPPPWFDAFRQALHGLGWTEGENITIVRRSTDRDRINDLAKQVAAERFDIVVAIATPIARAMKNATPTTPTVMAAASDPVGGGVVDNLERPGGNVTGLTLVGPELAGERIELLKEVVPSLSQVGLALPAGRRNEPRLLKGARIADLPVEEPTTFELVFNLRTARSLNLTIPPALLLRADQVIE